MLGERFDLLESFGLRYLWGELPAWFYTVWETVMTVPAFKNSQRDKLRPLGIKNQLLRVFHQEVSCQNREELISYLEPQQVALSKAGGGKLVNSVRMLSEERRDFVVIKIDMRNAFNEVSRTAMIETLEKEPTLQHIAWHAATVVALYGGQLWGEAKEGTAPGDPDSGLLVCVA